MSKAPPPGEELIRLLSEFDLKVGELALALREIILEELPPATERIFRAYALVFWYSLSGKMADAFCIIVVNRGHVNLMFNRGAELADSNGLLVGSGKIIRHLKVKRPEDLKQPHLRKFIRAAIKHAKSIAAARPRERLTRPRARAIAKRRTVK